MHFGSISLLLGRETAWPVKTLGRSANTCHASSVERQYRTLKPWIWIGAYLLLVCGSYRGLQITSLVPSPFSPVLDMTGYMRVV